MYSVYSNVHTHFNARCIHSMCLYAYKINLVLNKSQESEFLKRSFVQYSCWNQNYNEINTNHYINVYMYVSKERNYLASTIGFKCCVNTLLCYDQFHYIIFYYLVHYMSFLILFHIMVIRFTLLFFKKYIYVYSLDTA